MAIFQKFNSQLFIAESNDRHYCIEFQKEGHVRFST